MSSALNKRVAVTAANSAKNHNAHYSAFTYGEHAWTSVRRFCATSQIDLSMPPVNYELLSAIVYLKCGTS